MMKKLQKTILGLTLKDVMVFSLGFLIFTLGLVYYYHRLPVNSDDVAQKVLIHQLSFRAHVVLIPPDNFILKLPINLAVDAVVHNPTINVFVSTWVMNLIGFFLFFAVAKYFLRKYLKVNDTPFGFYAAYVLLCAGNLVFLSVLASPQIRTIEIGVSFAFLWFIDRYFLPVQPKRSPAKLCTLLGIGILSLGLFIYSDPAFLILLIVPVFIFMCVQALRERNFRDYLPLSILLVGAFIAYALYAKLFYLLGIHEYKIPAMFVPWRDLGRNIAIAFQGILALQNALFFGLTVISVHTLLLVFNFLMLLLITIIIPRKLGKQKTYWATFLAWQPAFLMLSYFLSNNVINVQTSRYVILLPFYGVLLIGLGVKSYAIEVRRIIYTGLVVAAVLSVFFTVQSLLSVRHAHPNKYHDHIASLLMKNHLEKGYAPYWNANVNTFFTRYKVPIFPVICSKQQVRPYFWVVNEALFQKPAQQTFLIVANYPSARATGTAESSSQGRDCTVQQAVSIFGEPQRIINVTDYTKIYVYSGDLNSYMSLTPSKTIVPPYRRRPHVPSRSPVPPR